MGQREVVPCAQLSGTELFELVEREVSRLVA